MKSSRKVNNFIVSQIISSERVSADAQFEALRDFSKHIRNRMIFFILFNIYAFLNVLSTTDKDIFLLIPKRMPLLDVELPLIAFYIVIPTFIVALHFNLLYKIAIYRKFLERTYKEYPKVIESMPFGIYEEVVLGQNLFLRFLIKTFFILTAYIFPLIVLLAFWYRFADYHHFILSSYHLALAGTSLLIILYFSIFRKIMKPIREIEINIKVLMFVKNFFIIIIYIVILFIIPFLLSPIYDYYYLYSNTIYHPFFIISDI